jgi:uncharacterized protein YjbI with pentapeptide repeats
MANKKHLAILKKGVDAWNEWREKMPEIQPDLNGANLSRADLMDADLSKVKLNKANLSSADLTDADFSEATLSGANLSKANLAGAYLSKANLNGANLRGANLSVADLSQATLTKADLSEADLSEATLRKANLSGAVLHKADLMCALLDVANLSEANLSGANLSEAYLGGANLNKANLSGADLTRVDLIRASLIRANLSGADLTGVRLMGSNFKRADLTNCRVYGVSAWNVKLEGAVQSNLIITPHGESTVTVDDLEVAQFIYLLLNNQKIRNVIDTVTSKAVLVLGRFTDKRKQVLDAVRADLRQRGYLPIIFDFEPSASRDLTETVTLLARMSRFIIADLTDPKSIPQELTSIIPDLTSVPVQPIILSSQKEYAMYEHWRKYPWVLPIQPYNQIKDLLTDLPQKIIAPAEAKASELTKR